MDNKKNGMLALLLGGATGTAATVLGILMLVIHVLTIVMAFSAFGIIGGALALIAPVLAEVVMFFIVLAHQGFMNFYCISIVVVVAVFVIASMTSSRK